MTASGGCWDPKRVAEGPGLGGIPRNNPLHMEQVQ